MPKFKVQIARTVTTIIEVDAASAKAAREEIAAYGADLAANDYRVVTEWLTRSVVQRVERA